MVFNLIKGDTKRHLLFKLGTFVNNEFITIMQFDFFRSSLHCQQMSLIK